MHGVSVGKKNTDSLFIEIQISQIMLKWIALDFATRVYKNIKHFLMHHE